MFRQESPYFSWENSIIRMSTPLTKRIRPKSKLPGKSTFGFLQTSRNVLKRPECPSLSTINENQYGFLIRTTFIVTVEPGVDRLSYSLFQRARRGRFQAEETQASLPPKFRLEGTLVRTEPPTTLESLFTRRCYRHGTLVPITSLRRPGRFRLYDRVPRGVHRRNFHNGKRS